MAVEHISQSNFDEVVSGTEVVLVDFFATWCNPCKILAPVLDQISEFLPENRKIVKIDIDENMEAARKFGVMSIPTPVSYTHLKRQKLGKILGRQQNVQITGISVFHHEADARFHFFILFFLIGLRLLKRDFLLGNLVAQLGDQLLLKLDFSFSCRNLLVQLDDLGRQCLFVC